MTPSAPTPDRPPAAPAGGLRQSLLSWPFLLLLIPALAGFAWEGSRFYLHHRDRVLMASALRAIDSGDFRSAGVWLQRLYLAHPADLSVNRLIARYDAAQRSPEELAWRARVVQIGPANLEDYLDWASVALRLGQTGVALSALDSIPEAWRRNAAYHELYGRALIAVDRPRPADSHFAAAAALDPSNPVHLINLAALRLTNDDAATRQSARATLGRVAASASPPVPALRALLDDALRQHDRTRIARFRSAMLRHGHLSLDDELACIDAAPTPKEAHADLVSLWHSVQNTPSTTLQVAEWMLQRGDSMEVSDWLRQLPAAEQSDVGIQTGEADALVARRDWPALQAYLKDKNWHDCDFLRIALLARCARETGGTAPAWADAVTACAHNGSDLLLLAQTAVSWSWRPEAEALYWRITELGYPSRGPALQSLWDLYSAAANTGGLLVVAHTQFKDCPNDAGVRNNFAFLSLLSGIGGAEAGRIAEENYVNQPENPNVAATYAYALYLQGRYQDGLRVLSRFGAQRMQAAGVALYLALLQQALGQKEAAAQSAAMVDPRKLLPEELLLLQKINPRPSGALPPPTGGASSQSKHATTGAWSLVPTSFWTRHDDAFAASRALA